MGEKFLNKIFQDMLWGEGLQFQECKNTDLKCAVVERARRTIREIRCKYFTYKNSYKYIDVLAKFDTAYNDKVYSTSGIAPSRVTDSDVLAIWKRMEVQRQGVRVATGTFRLGQHVHIRKEKMRFAKAAEQNFSTEIFRVAKVIERPPRVVHKVEDLNRTPIDGQFYREDLSSVGITNRAAYKIGKIIDKRVKRGIREYFVRWRGYSQR